MEQKKDFTKEFSNQKTNFRPWGILLLVSVLALLVVLPILFFVLKLVQAFLIIYILVFVILLILTLPKVIKLSKCPSCKKYMGRDVSKFCPVCGVQIQK